MTDIETAIMIKNMARETVRRMTAKNADATITLSRAQYDKIIENKTAVAAYKTCKHVWGFGGVTVTGPADAIATVKAAAQNAAAKNANVQMGGMDVTLKSGKKANGRLVLSEKNLEAARRQAEKYLDSIGVREKEYLFDGVNHVIYFYKNR